MVWQAASEHVQDISLLWLLLFVKRFTIVSLIFCVFLKNNIIKLIHFHFSKIKSFNSRRSELYLRKALFIREKNKESSNDFKLKSAQLATNNSQTSQENQVFHSLDSEYRYENSNVLNSYNNNNNPQTDCNFNEKYVSNEEKNNISEILFDLGCLLSTYESKLSKRE